MSTSRLRIVETPAVDQIELEMDKTLKRCTLPYLYVQECHDISLFYHTVSSDERNFH